MSLDSLELDHAEAIALLQPFVDDELSDEERELVAREIADNPAYQAFVREQHEVRAALRQLAPEAAPEGLRERVVAGLDEAQAARERERGWLAPVVGRIKAFGRGAMLMVPAAAAAAVLFVVASNSGWIGPELEGAHVDGGMASSLKLPARSERGSASPSGEQGARPVDPGDRADPGLPSGEELGFAVQVAPPRSLPADIALVSDSERAPGSSAMVRYSDSGGAVIVDRQRRAGVAELRGARQVFRGREYYLARDGEGRPRVEFEVGRVHHSLMLEGAEARRDAPVSVEAADFRGLLVVADALRQAHGG